MIKRKLQTMAEITEQTMVEEVERRLASNYGDVPAERISAIVRGAYAIRTESDPGLCAAVRRATRPG